MKLASLRDVFTELVRDLYNAETQLVKALPKLAKAASSEELRTAFEDHLEETRGQVERLEKLCENMDIRPKGKTCAAMKGLIEEGAEIIEMDGEPSALDAALIAAAQKVEHYEIAGYGAARTFAQILGEEEAVRLLDETLNEEKSADEKLTGLAESGINAEAADDEAEEDAESSEEEETAANGNGRRTGGRSHAHSRS